MKLINLFKKLPLLLLLFAMQQPLHAETIELCTTLDGSESIIPSDFQIQLDGLARALSDASVVSQDGSVTISVVHFANDARVEIPPTPITSAEVANEVATKVSKIKQSGLGVFTNIAKAIDLCVQQFSFTAEKQVIDIVTDGIHNQPGNPITSADNAIARGVDAINSLGVGQNLDIAELRAMVRPQPASSISEDGFFFQISDYTLFVDAIRAKISAETGTGIISPSSSYSSSMLSLGGGLCLATVDNLVRIQICDGSPNQQWVLANNRFTNPAGQCLTTNATGLIMADCNNELGQAWSLQGNQLVNGLGQCLTVPESDIYTHGGQVGFADCNGSANQSWKLSGTPLLNGTGRCLDVPNWDANGNIVHTWDCHAGQNQRWFLSGSRLINDYGRCLDIHAPSAYDNGAQAQIWDCIDDPAALNQTWTLNERNELVNGTGKCLDVNMDQANINGAKVQNWDCNDQYNQKWQFLFVNTYNGMIDGAVRHAIDSTGLSAVNIDVTANNILTSNGMTTDGGGYNVSNVPIRQNVVAEFTRSGFIPAVYNNINIQFGNRTTLAQVLLIPSQYAGLGTMTGIASSGINGGGLEGVNLRLRAGINTTSGNVVAETVSAADGTYRLEANGGNYTLEASKPGFVTSYSSVIVLGGEVRPNQNVTLVPILGTGEVRAVLTWGKSPLDLDAHATVPLLNGDRFHVFWPSLERGNLTTAPYALLDVDDVFSYGPETITFARTDLAGVYRFSVHDYTNRSQKGSKGLANSGAQVNIYNEYGLIATVNVPNLAGTLWTVFEIREGLLRVVNEMTDESNTRNVRDAGVSDIETDYDLVNKLTK